MEFGIETRYDQEAMTALARALRKTIRGKKSRRSHLAGTAVSVIGLYLVVSGEKFGIQSIITLAAVILIAMVLIFEDRINGYMAGKQILPGMHVSAVRFHEAGYHSSTEIGESDFHYDTIRRFVQSGDYFVFLFSEKHGQVYDSRNLTGGTVDEFITYITEKTGLALEIV